MTQRRHRLTVAGLTALAMGAASGTITLVACSASHDVAPLSSQTTGTDGGMQVVRPENDAAASKDASGTVFDAAASQPAIDTLCAMAMQIGSPERQIVSSESIFPAGGGNPVLGTYQLVNLDTYLDGLEDAAVPTDAGYLAFDASSDDGDGGEGSGDDEPAPDSLGDVLEQKTLVLAADGLYSLAVSTGTVDAGVGPSTITAGLYTVTGSTLTLHATCPSPSDTTYGFTASTGELFLFESTSSSPGITVDTMELTTP